MIYETLGTLNDALRNEILITIIVIVIMVMHLKTSLLITGLLPVTVLIVFIAMKLFKVDANIVALSGIAIAIGTIVDMGIVVSENMLRHLEQTKKGEDRLKVIFRATSEVGGAVVTAVSTTVVSFLPVFSMQAAEGKLFKPLAYTKTFALIASVIVALTFLPALSHMVYTHKSKRKRSQLIIYTMGLIFGVLLVVIVEWWVGLLVVLASTFYLLKIYLKTSLSDKISKFGYIFVIFLVVLILSNVWSPVGIDRGFMTNLLFVVLLLAAVIGLIKLFTYFYPAILRWSLDHKLISLSIPTFLIVTGIVIWMGFGRIFSFMPDFIKRTGIFVSAQHTFPGLGREFMPPLDEGSFLYMPTTMPHAGIEETIDILQKLDKAIYSVPEVELVVGKLGRADTPLDPAPISMIETVVNYKSEYKTDDSGRIILYRTNSDGNFLKDERGDLISDPRGKPYRQWREHIQSDRDIWNEIVNVARIPGTTSAPRLQPISARLVMLQSGMRAPMGIKIKGPDLESIENLGLQLEQLLKDVPAVEASAVIADRIVGKPYLEIDIDRLAIARYGIPLNHVQEIIEVAIGGKKITTTVEGRERYPVRVRYMRELRADIESLDRILVPTPDGIQIPLSQLAEIRYLRGPQAIKSEDTFLVGYVLFDKKEGRAEVDVVEETRRFLQTKIENGELIIQPGVSYTFAGSYENQVRASQRLRIILPLALFVIFTILYFQFRKVSTSLIVFSGILVAWTGGFILIWLYGQTWFLNLNFAGINLRDVFQIQPVNLSVAVWVGFLALFGIASDNGVIISSYIEQSFRGKQIKSYKDIRDIILEAGTRRIRPAMMTASTTILALIPVLTSSGRGSDIMIPMAIPSLGGMILAVISTFVVPVLYSIVAESRLKGSTDQDS